MKVCPLTLISSPARKICPNVVLTGNVFYREGVFLPPWPNVTHGHFGRQHPSSILGVYDRSGV